MPSLRNKNVIIGVSGGIAAYKIPQLVRLFIKEGAEVQVIMTPSAHRFVTPETLSTVSKNPVYTDFFTGKLGQWANHVELGLWADVFLVAPATANTLSKMANGISDNLLVTTYLSARCPVVIVPAMDLDMYAQPSTSRNLEQLRNDGCFTIDPGTGELASGLVGPGRMAEPEEIFDFVVELLQPQLLFSGKKVLVTAGPTYESIDPVRFIGNHSSGKMGFAIAQKFAELGAEVELVTGPVALPDPAGMRVTRVNKAEEMLQASQIIAESADIIVMAAAVADYKPAQFSESKIKKKDEALSLDLVRTTDILGTLAAQRRTGQCIVGFALETNDELNYARKKLESKNLDMVVMNSLNDAGAGFGHDTNKVTLITKERAQELPLKSKVEVAADIVMAIAELIK